METNPILAVISIILGILVIVFPALLSWIIGVFLVLLGLWMFYERYIANKNNDQPRQ